MLLPSGKEETKHAQFDSPNIPSTKTFGGFPSGLFSTDSFCLFYVVEIRQDT